VRRGRDFQAGGVVGTFSWFCVSVRGNVFPFSSFRNTGSLTKTLVCMKSFNVQRGGVRSQRSHDHVHVFRTMPGPHSSPKSAVPPRRLHKGLYLAPFSLPRFPSNSFFSTNLRRCYRFFNSSASIFLMTVLIITSTISLVIRIRARLPTPAQVPSKINNFNLNFNFRITISHLNAPTVHHPAYNTAMHQAHLCVHKHAYTHLYFSILESGIADRTLPLYSCYLSPRSTRSHPTIHLSLCLYYTSVLRVPVLSACIFASLCITPLPSVSLYYHDCSMPEGQKRKQADRRRHHLPQDY
jgi:hypothetical protein